LPASKRIIITVPESLLSEVDQFTHREHRNRSEIVREAIMFYLGERKKELMIEHMKKGYLEMADINLHMAIEDSKNEDYSNVIDDKVLE